MTDSDILLKELRLVFGGKEYVVDVLRCRAAAKWRKEFYDRTRDVSAAMIVENINDKGELSKAVGNALMGALVAFPEKVPELIFSYAPSLPKEEILDAAYDQEFAKAFRQIYEVAFSHFLGSLGMMLAMQKGSASQSALSASSN